MEQEMTLKKTVFKVGKAKVDHYNGVLMVDMFDHDYNRLGFHRAKDGSFAFDAFYLHERLLGEIDPSVEIRTVHGVIDFLKTQGVSMVYTGELER